MSTKIIAEAKYEKCGTYDVSEASEPFSLKKYSQEKTNPRNKRIVIRKAVNNPFRL